VNSFLGVAARPSRLSAESRPKRSTAASTRSVQAAASVTSHTLASTRAGSRCSTALRNLRPSRAQVATSASSRRSISSVANPMPELPPVTSTTRSRSPRSIRLSCSHVHLCDRSWPPGRLLRCCPRRRARPVVPAYLPGACRAGASALRPSLLRLYKPAWTGVRTHAGDGFTDPDATAHMWHEFDHAGLDPGHRFGDPGTDPGQLAREIADRAAAGSLRYPRLPTSTSKREVSRCRPSRRRSRGGA
jgi:hypothetical protein